MRITATQLRVIIKEEVEALSPEQDRDLADDLEDVCDMFDDFEALGPQEKQFALSSVRRLLRQAAGKIRQSTPT